MSNKSALRIILVDDHQLFREGLKRIINLENDMEIIAEFSDGEALFINYPDINPDVILMDINMPKMNGVEATKKVKELYPEAKIIILSIHDDEAYVFETLRVGASGYLLKDMDAGTLVDAIRAVAGGGCAFIHPNITNKVIEEYRRLSEIIETGQVKGNIRYADKVIDWHTILTSREIQVLKLMAEGNSNRGIAEKLFISEKTVKNHVSNILLKLNVQDRTQAVVEAIKNGWISFK